MKRQSLDDLRKEVQKTDEEIVRLLNQRAKLSQKIGTIKEQSGKDVYDPAQEQKVYDNIRIMHEGPLDEQSLMNIFREIISSSRLIQQSISVAYLGPEATFSHLAAMSYFGKATSFVSQSTIHDVFVDVEKGTTTAGVVPVENSLEGSVKMTLDRLVTTPLQIRGEIYQRISHALLSKESRINKIKRVYSHPQAFAQCQGWLRKQLPNCPLITAESTVAAVIKALDEHGSAAIGSRIAASTYSLPIVAESIEDNPLNTTRFLIIGKGNNKPTGRDKTSIVFGTHHKPGALYSALQPFAAEQIDMVRIESYPVRERMWEYLFFVDCAGHMDDPKLKHCLSQIEAQTTFLKVLGSYPRGEDSC